MLDRVAFLLIVLVPVFVGCGSGSNSGKRDAGTLHDAAVVPDGLASKDVLPTSEVLAPNDPLPDLVRLPDSAPDGESTLHDAPTVEAASDVLTWRDLAADDMVKDLPVEAESRDLPTFDLVMPGDQAARELAAESPVQDAAISDVAVDVPREAAREVLPFLVDGPLASFCSGDSPRMVLNGIESTPVVTGTYILMSCCISSAFVVETATFAEPILVTWQVNGGPYADPGTYDLANLRAGFTVRVEAGCDPKDPLSCTPSDAYESGLEGTLALASISPEIASLGNDMSLCLRLREPARRPHSLIHSLDLYAPHVLAAYH